MSEATDARRRLVDEIAEIVRQPFPQDEWRRSYEAARSIVDVLARHPDALAAVVPVEAMLGAYERRGELEQIEMQDFPLVNLLWTKYLVWRPVVPTGDEHTEERGTHETHD